MFGHLFYFLGLIIFITNLNLIFEFFDYIKLKEWVHSFKKVTKREPLEKDFKKGDYEKHRKYAGIIGLYLIWLFVGFISDSWKVFMILLLFVRLIDLICYLIGEFKMFCKLLNLSKLILLTISILILCINHFHLHLDLYQLLLGFIGR
jgi:hypothetical protein